MNLIELHIIQSFPVTCLNRDDVGSPKSALFGGIKRARLSSQSLKRAVRTRLQEVSAQCAGRRGRYVVNPLADAIAAQGVEPTVAREWAIRTAVALTKAKKPGEQSPETETIEKVVQKLEDEAKGVVSTALFLSPNEIGAVAVEIATNLKTGRPITSLIKIAQGASRDSLHTDGFDVALFGRMVAADPSLNVEGAAMFSHALSTHAAANETDYFSAVEEFSKGEQTDAGAAMIGSLEFNSATYYRYAAVNLDLLRSNVAGATEEEIRAVLDGFIRATLTAIPGARRNSMNGATLPTEALGIRKTSGQPLQLVNAFEAPVRANGNGLAAASVAAMDAHLEDLERIWGLRDTPVRLSKAGLEQFVATLIS